MPFRYQPKRCNWTNCALGRPLPSSMNCTNTPIPCLCDLRVPLRLKCFFQVQPPKPRIRPESLVRCLPGGPPSGRFRCGSTHESADANDTPTPSPQPCSVSGASPARPGNPCASRRAVISQPRHSARSSSRHRIPCASSPARDRREFRK